MILIGPGAMILIFLLAFRPVRFIVGWILFLALCYVGAFVVYALEVNS